MALGKILNLGGIDNRPPKANQAPGRFRVARNVMPTPDGRLIPRYDVQEPDALLTPANIPGYQAVVNYDGDDLAFAHCADLSTQPLKFYRAGIEVPSNFTIYDPTSGIPDYFTYSPYTPQSAQTLRRKNTVYLLSPTQGFFLKYDGVETSRCGVTVPEIQSSTYNSTGTKYIKVIKHCLDFDQNELWSEAVTFPMLSATTSLDLKTGLYSSPSTKLPQNAVLTGVSPSVVRTERWGSPVNFFKGTTTYSGVSGSEKFIVTCTANNTSITQSNQIGSYVFVRIESFNLTTLIDNPSTNTGFGLALKVSKVYSSGTIELSAYNPKYLDSNRQWQDAPSLKISSPSDMTGLASSMTIGCREVISVWASPSATGTYFYYALLPYVPTTASTNIYAITIPATPNATNSSTTYSTSIINLFPFLNTDYDITSTKVSPNSKLSVNSGALTPPYTDIFGSTFPRYFTCMGTYQGLLLLANDDSIWYSDPTAGGIFEQLELLRSIIIGNKEDGRIVSICGTSDFLIVSRERKNYYVNGDIVTGNFRTQEIEEAPVGAWSNSSTILVNDSVIMLTAIGIYEISDGARCTLLSKMCPKNFNLFDANSVNEDVSFKLSKVNSWDSDLYDSEEGISVTYDSYRGFLIFMQRKPGNPCLVLDTKTAEFYEWDGIIADSSQYANCITAINGKLYIGTVDVGVDYTAPTTYTAKVYNENISNTSELAYVTDYPIKLYTTWLTGGEPSLEKILLQLKMFGRIQSSSSSYSIDVSHYKDWNINTKITNSAYFPNNTAAALDDQTQYSHKKRFNSDKVLSASVGFEVSRPSVIFELESIEVEFSAIQEGMKR